MNRRVSSRILRPTHLGLGQDEDSEWPDDFRFADYRWLDLLQTAEGKRRFSRHCVTLVSRDRFNGGDATTWLSARGFRVSSAERLGSERATGLFLCTVAFERVAMASRLLLSDELQKALFQDLHVCEVRPLRVD